MGNFDLGLPPALETFFALAAFLVSANQLVVALIMLAYPKLAVWQKVLVSWISAFILAVMTLHSAETPITSNTLASLFLLSIFIAGVCNGLIELGAFGTRRTMVEKLNGTLTPEQAARLSLAVSESPAATATIKAKEIARRKQPLLTEVLPPELLAAVHAQLLMNQRREEANERTAAIDALTAQHNQITARNAAQTQESKTNDTAE